MTKAATSTDDDKLIEELSDDEVEEAMTANDNNPGGYKGKIHWTSKNAADSDAKKVEQLQMTIQELKIQLQQNQEQLDHVRKGYSASLSRCGWGECNESERADGKKFFTCSGCELIKYCSKRCHKLHWRDEHKHWCKRNVN